MPNTTKSVFAPLQQHIFILEVLAGLLAGNAEHLLKLPGMLHNTHTLATAAQHYVHTHARAHVCVCMRAKAKQCVSTGIKQRQGNQGTSPTKWPL